MERQQRAREENMKKKMMTERGMPSQMQEKLTKGEPKMNFGSNTAKFKSGFGVEGSKLNPKKGITAHTVSGSKSQEYAVSQKINKSELPSQYKSSRRNAKNDASNDDVNTAS